MDLIQVGGIAARSVAMNTRQRKTVRSLLQRFIGDRRGNIAAMFALSLVPMVGMVGAAIDYSHGNQVKAAMQAAADATALMLAQTATGLSDAQVTEKANSYFKAQFLRGEVGDLAVDATYTKGTGSQFAGSQVVVTASATVRTNFTGLLGVAKFKVAVDSQVKWGMGKLQVALALDNTGSMADAGKMTALKTATLNLLDMLKGAAVHKDDVQVAIIPFAKDVNIGKDHVNKNWIDWTAWEAANGDDAANLSGSICYMGTLWVVKNGGFSNGGACSKPTSGICYNGTLWNWSGTAFVKQGTCSGEVDHSSWNGCITDRTQDYDIVDTKPSPSIVASQFPAEQHNACPAQLMGLTNNWTSLANLVGLMKPNGNTNTPIGLFWAWMALSNGEPLNAPTKGPDTSQVIILLSDGMNTQNRWTNKQADIDARQAKLCDNIKKAGITIYAIQVNTGTDPLSNVMKNCATDASKFFMLTSASQIIATFTEIGTKISKIRISS
jgi:Flp pilus assembly protein TadG